MTDIIFLSFGYIGACLISTMQIPQIKHTFRQKTVKDLSLYTLSMNLSAAACMLMYASYYRLYPIMLANSCISTCDIILICLYFRYCKKAEPDRGGIII